MSDTEYVDVPYGDDPQETATLLLAAAEKVKGVDQSVVQVNTDTTPASFRVPKEVADEAGLGDKKEPAKKAAAKKK